MTKKLSEFYSFAFEYLKRQTTPLIEEGKITYEQLEEYTTKTDIKNLNYSLEDAQRMIIICLQDYQSMPKVINYKGRENEINAVICNLNSKEIAEKWEGEALYRKFCTMFEINNQDSKRNSWLKFSKSIVSSAKFLAKFDTVEEFKGFLDCFNYNEHTMEALPLLLSQEIFGIQFALACNWLKELGLTYYPKPDIHMVKVFSALGICEENQIECYKAMIALAKKCNVNTYQLDKVVWLICSGNYYRQPNVEIKSKKLRDNFIEEINRYEWVE